MNNGLDPRTGRQLGLQTGDPARFESFEEFYAAYEKQLQHFIDIKIRGNNIIDRLYCRHMPAPFLSLLIDDCIAHRQGLSRRRGALQLILYPGGGLGHPDGCLTAIQYHVFDKKTFSMEALLAALKTDFQGQESLRQLLLNKTPRYGNDDDYADRMHGQVVRYLLRPH